MIGCISSSLVFRLLAIELFPVCSAIASFVCYFPVYEKNRGEASNISSVCSKTLRWKNGEF